MPFDSEAVRGAVFDIQRMSIHDGPGIRTTVFLKGCPLRCAWCHNPEGYERRPQLAFSPALCIGCGYCFEHCPNGAHAMRADAHHLDRAKCAECFACAEECYSGALEVVGQELTVTEVLEEVLKDRAFYEGSGGGMTISGGEPLAQFDFTRRLLALAKSEGIHTCVETSGFASAEHIEGIADTVDLFLYDWKETDPERHRACTGQSNESILRNLRLLDDRGAAIVLRCPIVPGLNLRDDHLQGIAQIARSLKHCQGVNVMGHHGLGEAKRSRFGGVSRDTPFTDMRPEEIESVIARLQAMGVADVTAG